MALNRVFSFIRRLLTTVGLLLLVFTASRLMVRALPGNPVETILAETGTSLSLDELQSEFGLQLSWHDSLERDLIGFLHHGDWGKSIHSREPVRDLILSHFLKSLQLGSLAFVIALALSLFLAAGSVLGSQWIDRICTLHSALFGALPTPWIGPILAFLFAVKIPIFDINGALGLPLLLLSLNLSAFWSRLIRQRLRDGLASDMARFARSKGLSEFTILAKHVLAPSLGFFLGYFGSQLGQVLAGSMMTEVLFDWPGMGSLLIGSVLKRDYPVVEACIFASSSLILISTRVGDLLSSLWDPRGSSA